VVSYSEQLKIELLGVPPETITTHGVVSEATAIAMAEGALRPSSMEANGERFFAGAPGVYAHKDATQRKADNYVRFVQLLPRWFPLCC
jgi:hypothetical protein